MICDKDDICLVNKIYKINDMDKFEKKLNDDFNICIPKTIRNLNNKKKKKKKFNINITVLDFDEITKKYIYSNNLYQYKFYENKMKYLRNERIKIENDIII